MGIPSGAHSYSTYEGLKPVSPLLVRVVCTNGLIREDPFRKVHIGGRSDVGDIWSKDTRIHEANLILSEVADVIRYAFDPTRVQDYMNKLNKLTEIHIDPTEVKLSSELLSLTLDEAKTVLARMEKNTAYELIQATTSYANDILENTMNQ